MVKYWKYGKKIIFLLFFLVFFIKLPIYGYEIGDGEYNGTSYATIEQAPDFYHYSYYTYYVPRVDAYSLPSITRADGTYLVFCLNPGVAAPSDWKYITSSNVNIGGTTYNALEGSLNDPHYPDNYVQGESYANNSIYDNYSIASDVMSEIIKLFANQNDSNLYYRYVVTQLVLWRIQYKFVKLGDTNSSFNSTLKWQIILSDYEKNTIKNNALQVPGMSESIVNDQLNKIADKINWLLNDYENIIYGNIDNRTSSSTIVCEYPQTPSSPYRDPNTQLLIGYPRTEPEPGGGGGGRRWRWRPKIL